MAKKKDTIIIKFKANRTICYVYFDVQLNNTTPIYLCIDVGEVKYNFGFDDAD